MLYWFKVHKRVIMYPKPGKKKRSKNKISAAEKKRAYEAVTERSEIDGYPACEHIMPNGERCKHNGSKYPLHRAHMGGHDLPKSRDLRTTEETMYVKCSYCHSMGDHFGSVPIFGESGEEFWELPRD